MSQKIPKSITTYGVGGDDPSLATFYLEGWKNELHMHDEIIPTLEAKGVDVTEKKREREVAALEAEAWELRRALDDPSEAHPLLVRRFEEAKRKVVEFKNPGARVPPSDKSSTASGSR
ncbi:hypothetical protein DL771_008863 [Monosporascus sp. 5C6A]|nr:hypothetical protein DL771_008863 [Monosporascus sp. 5C6A]